MGLLSEALGLKPDHLNSLDCTKGLVLGCDYYPACPNPELTLGADRHSDIGTVILLLQNNISGLQVLHAGQWVRVPPIPGVIVVNIGDLVQIISNGKLKSAEHRVISSHFRPRISVACFCFGRISGAYKLYKPIEELALQDHLLRYKEIILRDYISRFYSKKLEGKSNLEYYKL